MKIIKKFKFELILTAILIVLGQLAFFVMSSNFTAMSYEGRIYVTNGVRHAVGDQLYSDQQAAHFFNETIIGWLRFPNFQPEAREYANLPNDAALGGYLQERQNAIFTVSSVEQLEETQLVNVQEFIQNRLDEYNAQNDTKYFLSNPDYEIVPVQKSYQFGAAVALLVSLVLGIGVGFVRREFF